ncbi:conserved hypothetical protein [Enterobacterales bacterium 8AC]|nr:conserved hypothetical protein [Enterobacterales bacterium 8AC]
MLEKLKKSRNHRTKWTIAELTFMEAHYGTMSTVDIARHLGRTVVAVRLMAQGLGLCKTQTPAWTEQEIAVLHAHYAEGAGIRYVQALLPGRIKAAIMAKVKELGITSARNWHPDEVQVLREFYPEIGTQVAYKLPRRSRDAVKIKARQLGLQYRALKHRQAPSQPWTPEEWCLLEDNLALPYEDLMPLFPDRTRLALEKAKGRLKLRILSKAFLDVVCG